MEKNKLRLLPHGTPQNYLKMYHGTKYKRWHDKNLRRKHFLGLSNGFLDMTGKAQMTKEKNINYIQPQKLFLSQMIPSSKWKDNL